MRKIFVFYPFNRVVYLALFALICNFNLSGHADSGTLKGNALSASDIVIKGDALGANVTNNIINSASAINVCREELSDEEMDRNCDLSLSGDLHGSPGSKNLDAVATVLAPLPIIIKLLNLYICID